MYAYELMESLREQYPESGLSGFFRRLERALERVWQYRDWRFARSLVVLYPHFETSGMTVVNGSAICGSSSGIWASEHVGASITIVSDSDPDGLTYTIAGVTDATTITLDGVWTGTTSTGGATGTTLQLRYALPADCLRLHGVWYGSDADVQVQRPLCNPEAYTVDAGYGGSPRVCFRGTPVLGAGYLAGYKRRWVTAVRPSDAIDVWAPLESALEAAVLLSMLSATQPTDEVGMVRWQALRQDAKTLYQDALMRAAAQEGTFDPKRLVTPVQPEFLGWPG